MLRKLVVLHVGSNNEDVACALVSVCVGVYVFVLAYFAILKLKKKILAAPFKESNLCMLSFIQNVMETLFYK